MMMPFEFGAMDQFNAVLFALGVAGAVIVAIMLIAFVIAPAVGLGGRFARHIFRFIGAELSDLLRLIGALVTAIVLIPITLVNVLIGRWSASSHYGRAIEGECRAMGGAAYRLMIGNPARLLGLGALTEGLERRLPVVVAGAPPADRPRVGGDAAGDSRRGVFEGWKIIGSLPGGGSGAKLYIAEPSVQKTAALVRQGTTHVDRVVIKSFSLREGSTLPQIIRESRALPAARRLGLILEHDLTTERFYYVTRYVPGESLAIVTQRLHSSSGGPGLDQAGLRASMSYASDLLRTLSDYHSGGLWHKDVKPDNVIVSDGRAHLVDFGLITPLRSSMTLTTHGTEYFRDPEMVRMALRGAKVHEVDGAKFDLYAVGAVLFATIENSFPAHGGLSQITKRCPEAIRWIVRRAMTDYDKRYETAGAMLADLDAVLRAPDCFAVKPVELPSFRANRGESPAAVPASWEAEGPSLVGEGASAMAANGPAMNAAAIPASEAPEFAPVALPGATGRPEARAGTLPRIRLTNWWSGRYEAEIAGGAAAELRNAGLPAAASVEHAAWSGRTVRTSGARAGAAIGQATAAQQLVRARARIDARRARAQTRIATRRSQFEPAGVNTGVWIAAIVVVVFVALVVIPAGLLSFVLSPPGSAQSARSNETGASVVERDRDSWGFKEPPAGEVADRAWVVGSADADAAKWRSMTFAESAKASAESGSVMVLRDPVSYGDPQRQSIDERVRRLVQNGFRVIGERGIDSEVSASTATETDELVAALRREIGVQTLGAAAARDAVQAWLADRPEVSMVIWFGRGDDGGARAWLLTGTRHADNDIGLAARTLAGLGEGAAAASEKPLTGRAR